MDSNIEFSAILINDRISAVAAACETPEELLDMYQTNLLVFFQSCSELFENAEKEGEFDAAAVASTLGNMLWAATKPIMARAIELKEAADGKPCTEKRLNLWFGYSLTTKI